MSEKDKAIKEVLEVISDGQMEIRDEKNVNYDQATGQFSIKIPKSFALKSNLAKDSEFGLVFNPKESQEQILNSRLVIYLKEGDTVEGKEDS